MLQESQQTQTTQTQTQTQTQMELTQMTQDQFADETSNMSPCLSPPPELPWGRLVPCVPSSQAPIDLIPSSQEYWLGRSSRNCQVTIQVGKGLSKKETTMMAWAHSMISNQHCRIYIYENSLDGKTYLEDASGNGTCINASTWLRKGENRLLHSGDEICLVNPSTLRKKIPSARVLQAVVQQYSYIYVQVQNSNSNSNSQQPPRKQPCVNPRAMNYNYHNRSQNHSKDNATTSTSTSPRSLGRRIEAAYDIREVLGDGTSGQVRRAIHRQSGTEYAVKVISLRRHLDTTNMEHEVSLLQSLDHPYIVQLVDVFVHHGVAMYLVMELVAGGDLFDRIVEHQRYTQVDARRVMRRLLSAVFYLHEHCNVVHRDLKPENILCQSPTHVKLADFGLAKIMKDDGLKTFCGTPQYFAPEVLQRRHTVAGSGRYGKPADMWSLGVILYILLTGKPPFGADMDEPQQLDFEEDDDGDSSSTWKAMPFAQDLVQQLLRHDPKRRLAVRQACDHPWINIDDGDTHIHPLDDPMVTARKRLFTDKEDDTASLLEGEETDNNSILSKEDSVLSKEEFAAAAVSHAHTDSVLFDKVTFSVEKKTIDKNQLCKDIIDEDFPSAAFEEGLGTKMMSVDDANNDENNATTITKDTQEDEPKDTASSSASPEAAAAITTADSSVTPSDFDASSPRASPYLEGTDNLNERSNRFREHVLQTHNSNTVDSPEDSRLSTNNSPQVAVTPNTSNVRNKQSSSSLLPALLSKDEEQQQQQQKTILQQDDILSQFSSEPSSLESFPDTPAGKQKRSLDEAVTTTTTTSTTVEGDQQPEAKRQKKHTKQTTLSSFFVKTAKNKI